MSALDFDLFSVTFVLRHVRARDLLLAQLGSGASGDIASLELSCFPLVFEEHFVVILILNLL